MDSYQLIGLDQMEASIVRRYLHQWSKADEQAILPLLVALQQGQCLANVQIKEPRWETNVYRLYFYWAYHQKVVHKEVTSVCSALSAPFPKSSYASISTA